VHLLLIVQDNKMTAVLLGLLYSWR